MVDLLNEAARRLEGEVEVRFIGRNKSGLYGRETALSPLVRQLGEIDEDDLWDHVRRARVGLAFAAGPDPFDNDLAKIWAYLRGGLPILGEERLANAWAFLDPGFGATFRYGDPADLAAKVRLMCAAEADGERGRIAAWAAAKHSWDARAADLLRFFRRVLKSL